MSADPHVGYRAPAKGDTKRKTICLAPECRAFYNMADAVMLHASSEEEDYLFCDSCGEPLTEAGKEVYRR